MPVDYKKIEFALHEILVQIEDAYKLLEFDPAMLREINACKDLVKTKRYTVAVMGEFKRGKSSLINALLGSEILPADATPTTATINRITYAPTPKVTVTYHDGAVEEIELHALTEYVTKLTTAGEHRALSLKEATVYYPSVICQNYVDIIDTPGLNDEERMTRITIEMLEHVDAVIVPIHARAPFSETEKNFVCQLVESENIHNIVFVMTFIDQLRLERDRYQSFLDTITERIQTLVFEALNARNADDKTLRRAHEMLDQLRLYGLSSALALESFISNNLEDLERSGFNVFKEGLLHVVTAKQMENAVTKCVGQIRGLLSQREAQNQQRMEALHRATDALHASYQAVCEYCGSAQQRLDTILAGSYEGNDRTIRRMYEAKDAIVSIFIKALSEIRVYTHEEILRVMVEASVLSEQMVLRDYLLPVQDAIRAASQADVQTLLQQWQSAVLSHQDVLGATFQGLRNAPEAFNTYAISTLDDVKFAWTSSPLPRVSDLSRCNVIETVIAAADIAVNEVANRFNKALADIRKGWFERVSSDTKEINALVSSCYQKQQEALDRKVKAQINNYLYFDGEAKKILTQCDKLLIAIGKEGLYDMSVV